MARMSSNRDRIARMREEAAAASKSKPKRAAGRSKRTAEPDRMKIVWGIKNGAGQFVRIYPYPYKAAAEAEAERMREDGERGCIVCPHKIPLEG